MSRVLMRKQKKKTANSANLASMVLGNKGETSEEQGVRGVLIAEQKAIMEQHEKAGKVEGKSLRETQELQRDKEDEFMLGITVQKKPKYMINPRSWLKTAWDLFIMCLVIYLTIQVPLDLTFNLETDDWQGWIFRSVNYLCVIFFFVDMGLTFITCRENRAERTLITNQKTIAKMYVFSGDFFLDFLATFPFDLLLSELKPLRCLRIIRMYRLMSYIQVRTQRPGYIPVLLGICFTATWGLLMMHFASCSWIFLLEEDQKLIDGEYKGTLWDVYLRGVYWVVTTVTTVGYGDITPKTNSQIIFAVIMEMLGVAVYAYLVGRMTDSILNVRRDIIEFRDRMSLLNAYMQYRRYPKKLQRRIWEFHQYTWDNRLGESIFGPVMSMLSPALENSVHEFDTSKVILKSPMLNALKGPTKRALSAMMKGVSFTPGQHVYRAGDLAEYLFFVERGVVHVKDAANDAIMRVVEAGGVFGAVEAKSFLEANLDEMGIGGQRPRRGLNAVANTYCVVYAVQLNDFKTLFKAESELNLAMRNEIMTAQAQMLSFMNVFSELDDNTKSKVFEKMSMLCVNENNPVYLIRDHTDHVYFVFNGVLTTVRLDHNINVHPGEIAGMQEVVDGQNRRKGSCFAKKSAVLFGMSSSSFREYYSTHDGFNRAVTTPHMQTKWIVEDVDFGPAHGARRNQVFPMSKGARSSITNSLHLLTKVLPHGRRTSVHDEQRGRSASGRSSVFSTQERGPSYSIVSEADSADGLNSPRGFGGKGKEQEGKGKGTSKFADFVGRAEAKLMDAAPEKSVVGAEISGPVERYEKEGRVRRRSADTLSALGYSELLKELERVKDDIDLLNSEMWMLNSYREELYEKLNTRLAEKLAHTAANMGDLEISPVTQQHGGAKASEAEGFLGVDHKPDYSSPRPSNSNIEHQGLVKDPPLPVKPDNEDDHHVHFTNPAASTESADGGAPGDEGK